VGEPGERMKQSKSDCNFCGKTEIEFEKYIISPEHCICYECVEKISVMMLSLSVNRNYIRANTQDSVRCNFFCRKPAKQVWQLITDKGKGICSECLEICNNVLGDLSSANEAELSVLRAAKLRKLNKSLSNNYYVSATIISDLFND
jgi:ATP-dependent protease Clp ATPase subunit